MWRQGLRLARSVFQIPQGKGKVAGRRYRANIHMGLAGELNRYSAARRPFTCLHAAIPRSGDFILTLQYPASSAETLGVRFLASWVFKVWPEVNRSSGEGSKFAVVLADFVWQHSHRTRVAVISLRADSAYSREDQL